MKKIFLLFLTTLILPWQAFAAVDIKNDATLGTNLVSCWSMDESSTGAGAVSRADSKGSNTLTDNNTVASAAGKFSNGADFERSNSEYLSIADASQSGLDFTSSFSFAYWLKPESVRQMNIMNKWVGTGNQRSYSHEVTPTTIGFNVSPNGTTNASMTPNPTHSLATSTWAHIAISWNDSTDVAAVFFNGSLISSSTLTSAGIFNSTSAFQLGKDQGTTAYLDGILDEFAIWSKAITTAEVVDLYNGGTGIPCVSSASSYAGQPTIIFD